MSEPEDQEIKDRIAYAEVMTGKKLYTAAELNEKLAGMREACKQQCRIVRDSPVRCVDPCTEDWIAQRIDMLDDSAADAGVRAIERRVLDNLLRHSPVIDDLDDDDREIVR